MADDAQETENETVPKRSAEEVVARLVAAFSAAKPVDPIREIKSKG